MGGDEAAQLAALAAFDRLDARPVIEKLKQKMRLQGMRGVPRGPRPATRENPFGLLKDNLLPSPWVHEFRKAVGQNRWRAAKF